MCVCVFAVHIYVCCVYVHWFVGYNHVSVLTFLAPMPSVEAEG